MRRFLLSWTTLAMVLGSATRGPADEPFERLRWAAERLRPLHTKKKPPRPGDWLSVQAEPGQTFDQYRASNPNRPDSQHTTLYLQPLGSFSERQQRLLRETADLLERFWGVPVQLLPTLGLEVIPPEAQRVHPQWGDRQVLSTYVLEKVLRPRRPPEAVAVLALTSCDLWPGRGWNFVFGQASLRDRVGVWSLYRYGTADGSPKQGEQFRRRLFKVAVHETGHMFGLWHCTAYECGMNGSNHLAEMDARPLWFCPECLQKLWWACRVDPAERFRKLIAFAERHGLQREAAFWRRSLQKLTD